MFVSIFSPDGKNFYQFMTPNVPKPMFLAPFHPGLVGALAFIFPKSDIDIFRGLSIFLAISHIFPGPYMERFRRVSMKVSIFSPDGKNFCQFMTPNVPKPRCLAQFHPGLLGGVGFLFFQN